MELIELNEMFFLESQEMLDNAAFIIADAEKNNRIIDVINEVFRTFHSIKGASQTLGFEEMGNLAHFLEDLLDYIRVGRIDSNDSEVLSLILESIDLLQLEIYAYRSYGSLSEEIKASHQVLQKTIEEKVASLGKRQATVVKTDVLNNKDEKSLNAQSDEKEKKIEEKKLKECYNFTKGEKRYFVIFTVSKEAVMPQVTKLLIGQRVKECAKIIGASEDLDNCALVESDNPYELSMIVETKVSSQEFRQMCNVSDVKSIHVLELSSLNVLGVEIQAEDVELLLEKLTQLVLLVKELSTNTSNLRKAVQQAIQVGNDFVEKYCRRKIDLLEWERRVRLLEKVANLYSGGVKKSESRLVVNSLVKDLWEGIYAFVNNRSYFFTVVLESKLDEKILEREVNEIFYKAHVRAIAIDLSALEVLEMKDILALKKIKEEVTARGLQCFVFSNGRYTRRQMNIVEAVYQKEEFRVYDSLFNAFYQR